MASMVTLGSHPLAPFIHVHYLYKMKFCNIQKLCVDATCNLMEQREKTRSQSSREYWKNLQASNTTENYLAYCNKTHCALIHTDFESIPASSATADRNYPLVRVPTEEDLGLKPSVQEYVGDIIASLTSGLIPVVTHDEILDQFRISLRTQVLTLWERSQVQNEVASILPQLVTLFESTTVQPAALTLDKEVQFNSWLAYLMEKKLSPCGFMVERFQLNKNIHPNCCEFATSMSDCVVYHATTLFKDPNISVIVIHDDSSDSSDSSEVNVVDADEVSKVQVDGCTLELKVEGANEAAINECAYNMFGTGTRLATWGLEMGKIVNMVTVYGLVVAMKEPDKVRLLKLTINFEENSLNYKICMKNFTFQQAMNMVLQKLEKV